MRNDVRYIGLLQYYIYWRDINRYRPRREHIQLIHRMVFARKGISNVPASTDGTHYPAAPLLGSGE